MIAVGVDLSLERTGLVAVRVAGPLADYERGHGPDVVHLALVASPKKARGMERLAFILDHCRLFLDQLESALGEQPAVATFEGPAFRSQIAHSLGHVHGLVKLHFWQRLRGTVLLDVPPANLKQFVTERGDSEKSQMVKEVFKRWGFDTDDDNLCDAYACALMGVCRVTGSGTVAQVKAAGNASGELYGRRASNGAGRAAVRQVAGRPRRRRRVAERGDY